MSMTGKQRLELERKRKEALRLEQVRQECRGLVKACEEMVRNVRDVAVQQFAATSLQQSSSRLKTLKGEIEKDPDHSWLVLKDICNSIQGAIVTAESEAKNWSAQQAEAIAKARTTQTIASSSETTNSEEAIRLSREACKLAEEGEIESAGEKAESALSASTQASQSAHDETVRKEVVKGLLATLKNMGFVVVGPKISKGIVTLEGRLASGKKARFEISLDGEMEFDLDGYEGRSCAKEMEKVEQVLRDQYGVKMGPSQVVWKNPDRIGSSAQDLPGYGQLKR